VGGAWGSCVKTSETSKRVCSAKPGGQKQFEGAALGTTQNFRSWMSRQELVMEPKKIHARGSKLHFIYYLIGFALFDYKQTKTK
jgi:hypothetical protein